jgi:REP element-mobilizing transposase RayT
MPNHIHGIIIIEYDDVGATRRVALTKNKPSLQSGTLGAIIGQFKSKVTKKIREAGKMQFKWQRNYYEHIIRNERDLYRIRKYIELNPLKWELDEYYRE